MEKEKFHFPIIIEQDEDNIYIISCLVFKGCHSYGNTIDEAMKNIQETIEMYLEDGQPSSLNHFIGFREIELQIAV